MNTEREALAAARKVIAQDRDVLVQSYSNASGAVDADAQPFLAEYDETLALIDAALASKPDAAPAGGAVEALRELVAVEDLKKSFAEANYHASRFPTDENYAVIDQLATELGRRKPSAWAAARAALAAAPVSPPESNSAMTAALMMLFDAANEIHGTLDEQTYDEKRRADWDLPDDHAFAVTITAAHERALAKAICGVEAASRAHLAAAPAALAVQPLPLLDQSANALGASPCGGPGSAASRPEPQSVSALRAPIPGADTLHGEGK